MNKNSSKDKWDSCPSGLISELKKSKTAERRRFLLAVGTGASGVLIASLIGGFFAEGEPAAPIKKFYSCDEMKELVAKFSRREFSEHEMAMIRTHLELCPPCLNLYEANGITLFKISGSQNAKSFKCMT